MSFGGSKGGRSGINLLSALFPFSLLSLRARAGGAWNGRKINTPPALTLDSPLKGFNKSLIRNERWVQRCDRLVTLPTLIHHQYYLYEAVDEWWKELTSLSNLAFRSTHRLSRAPKEKNKEKVRREGSWKDGCSARVSLDCFLDGLRLTHRHSLPNGKDWSTNNQTSVINCGSICEFGRSVLSRVPPFHPAVISSLSFFFFDGWWEREQEPEVFSFEIQVTAGGSTDWLLLFYLVFLSRVNLPPCQGRRPGKSLTRIQVAPGVFWEWGRCRKEELHKDNLRHLPRFPDFFVTLSDSLSSRYHQLYKSSCGWI